MVFVNTKVINVAVMWRIRPRCRRDQGRNKQKACRVIAVNIKWTGSHMAVELWEQRFAFMHKEAIFFLQLQVQCNFIVTCAKLSQFYSDVILIQTLCPKKTIEILMRDHPE